MDDVELLWDKILKMDWKIDKVYGPSYLIPEEYNKQVNNLSELRRLRAISNDDRYVIFRLLEQGRRNYQKLREYIHNAPRRDAQSFIGKKNIRSFIFKRDGYKCLCCNSRNHLSIDHIVPVFNGGVNRLYNLQTLCRGCNTRKGTKIIDYR